MKITNNFRSGEFHPITAPDNVKANVKALVINILQPLRIELDRPMTITSGWRSAGANARAGGVNNSQHLTGEAADFIIRGISGIPLCRCILKAAIEIKPDFDQLIIYETFVHISYSKTRKNRHQLIFKNPASLSALISEEVNLLIFNTITR